MAFTRCFSHESGRLYRGLTMMCRVTPCSGSGRIGEPAEVDSNEHRTLFAVGGYPAFHGPASSRNGLARQEKREDANHAAARALLGLCSDSSEEAATRAWRTAQSVNPTRASGRGGRSNSTRTPFLPMST